MYLGKAAPIQEHIVNQNNYKQNRKKTCKLSLWELQNLIVQMNYTQAEMNKRDPVHTNGQ